MARITVPQGFLIHDRRIEVGSLTTNGGGGTTDSSYTEAGPQPGSALADDSCSKVRPQVHGAQSEAIDLSVQRGGRVGGSNGAASVWRRTSDGAAAYQSWNPPTVLTAMQVLEYESNSATSDYDDICVVVVPRSQKVIAVAIDQQVIVGNNGYSWTYTPATRSWASKATIGNMNNGTGVSSRIFLAGTYLEDACRTIVVGAKASDSGRAWSSDDDGATWSQYASEIFDVAPDIGGRGGLEQDRYGNLYYVRTDGTDVLAYYSEDQGHSFTLLDDDGLAWSNHSMCRTVAGDILIAYIRAGSAYCRKVRTAFDAPDASGEITIRNTAGETDIAVYLDPSGQLWAAVIHGTATHVVVLTSSDDGDTWTEVGGLFNPSVIGSAASTLANIRAVGCCGEAMILCNPKATTSTTTGTLMAIQAGGWDSIEHQPDFTSTTSLWSDRVGWADPAVSSGAGGITWHSLELPGNSGWTQTGTAPTMSADGWLFSTAAAASYAQYGWTYSQAVLGWIFEVQVNSGGAITDASCGMKVRREDGTNRTSIEIRLSTTQVRIYDTEDSSIVGTTSIDWTSHKQLLVVYSSLTALSLWYRDASSSTWTEIGQYTGLTTSASATTAEFMQIGHPDSGTANSNWLWVGFSSEKVVRTGLTAGTNTQPIRYGKNLDARPYPVRDDGDDGARMRLSMSGGPARKGETFTIEPRYNYGVDLLHPQIAASPKRSWRSTSGSTAVDIVWDLGEDTRFQPGWTLGAAFVGETIPRSIQLGTLEDGGSTWTLRGTYDGATDFTSLTYALSGNLLSPGATGTTGGRFIHDNEFVGGYVIIDPTGTPKMRKIVGNSGGWWGSAAEVEATFRLDDIDGTEASTGTVHLVHPGGVLLCPFTTAEAFRYVRIRVPAATSVPDSFYSIGSLCLGAVMIPGHQVSRGWSMRWAPNVRSETDDYGTIRVTKRGPLRRQLTFSWQDLIDEIRYQSTETGDYAAPGSSTPGEAMRNDVVSRLVGMMTESKSGELPVTAIWALPDSNSATTITDPDQWLYGRLQGTIQANQITGSIGTDVVRRVESLTITELPWDTD